MVHFKNASEFTINAGDIVNIVMHADGTTIDIAPAKPRTPPNSASPQPLTSQRNEPAMNPMSLGELTNNGHLGQALTADDYASIEVWVADKDGEIFNLQHVIYDEEKRRLYLVRAWHGDGSGEGDVTFDTDLKAKVRVLEAAKTTTPTPLKDTHDSAKDWDEEDQPTTNADSSDAEW